MLSSIDNQFRFQPISQLFVKISPMYSIMSVNSWLHHDSLAMQLFSKFFSICKHLVSKKKKEKKAPCFMNFTSSSHHQPTLLAYFDADYARNPIDHCFIRILLYSWWLPHLLMQQEIGCSCSNIDKNIVHLKTLQSSSFGCVGLYKILKLIVLQRFH